LLFAYYNNFAKVNLIMSCIKSKASYPQINWWIVFKLKAKRLIDKDCI
jgi:hypothetical protein